MNAVFEARNTDKQTGKPEWDAIIIGAGAAGAVFANELTTAGLKVLMLEMGPRYSNHRSDFAENEMAMWERVWDNGAYRVTGDGFSGAPNLGFGVGGGTLVWTAVALRMFEHDFKARTTYGQPAGSSLEDWPLTLRELEPFYEEAERQMGVAGTIAPWDPASRCAPPNPAHPLFKGSQLLQQGMKKLGIRSAPGPVAIASRNWRRQSACLNCGFCRSGCRIDAKYQSDHALIDVAQATGRLKLVTGVVVTRIVQDSAKHVSGVNYVDIATRTTLNARARVVIACNNPLELPRLFLNSANPYSPAGLGNQYDTVGRHFFSHLGTIGAGLTPQCLDASVGFNMGNLITLDYARARKGAGYAGGFAIESLNGAGAGVMAVDPYRNLWGSQLKQAMQGFNQSIFTVTFCEGIPVRDNRITVDADRVDAWGLPNAHIHYQLHANDHTVFTDALNTTRSILSAAGATSVAMTDSPFDAHPAGTMRMGHDPKTSVVNPYGKVHGLDNVYIGGSAQFVTGSSVNPTLTLHALAIRSARHIVREFAHNGFAVA
ncbi:GMC family oxidoreductase [Burkholderiaceae bacterium DAT-1]|nr:GMC family oxidoreductase [Burkholderiaceae bacterium DAT-1]